MTQCVLLNADYTFLNMVDWKRAMCLMVKGKVKVLKHSEKIIRKAEGAVIKIPSVMRLIKLIRTLYRSRVPFSKKKYFCKRWIQMRLLWRRECKINYRSYSPKITRRQNQF